MSVHRLCKASEVIEGEPVGVDLPNGHRVAVYKLGGDYFVTDDLCTHGNAHLSEGWQEGDIIECPFHGGSFCITTGEPTNYPCVKAIRTYPVSLVDGEVTIEFEEARETRGGPPGTPE